MNHIEKISVLDHHIDLLIQIFIMIFRSKFHFTYGSSCSNLAFEHGMFTFFLSYDFLPGHIYQDFYAYILQSGLGKCFNDPTQFITISSICLTAAHFHDFI